jgi:hypothetical protein
MVKRLREFDAGSPPKGARFEKTPGGFIVGATTRHPRDAAFIVPFVAATAAMLLWSVYGGETPAGGYALSEGITVSLILFGILTFAIDALMTLFGRIEVRIDGEKGKILTGFGPVMWTRKFDWSDVDEITSRPSSINYPGCRGRMIVLEGKRRVRFGSGVRYDRQSYMLAVLLKMLMERQPDKFEDVEVPQAFDLENPPKGAWFAKTDRGFATGAFTRSFPGLVPLVFAGLISFVLIGSVYNAVRSGSRIDMAGYVFVLVLLLAGIGLWALALMMIFGRVTVEVRDGRGKVFTGVGPLGFIRRFNLQDVGSVEEEILWHTDSGSAARIILEGKHPVKFGKWLSEKRRRFLLFVLRRMLAGRDMEQ